MKTTTSKTEVSRASSRNATRRTGTAGHNSKISPAGKQVGDSGEISNIRSNLDNLISRIPTLSETDIEQAKADFMQDILSNKKTVKRKIGNGRQKIGQGIKRSKHFIKEKPFKAFSFAAGVGLLLGAVSHHLLAFAVSCTDKKCCDDRGMQWCPAPGVSAEGSANDGYCIDWESDCW